MDAGQKAKMTVSVGQIFNLGSYESARFDWSAEFLFGESSFEKVADELKACMESWAKEQGWVR